MGIVIHQDNVCCCSRSEGAMAGTPILLSNGGIVFQQGAGKFLNPSEGGFASSAVPIGLRAALQHNHVMASVPGLQSHQVRSFYRHRQAHGIVDDWIGDGHNCCRQLCHNHHFTRAEMHSMGEDATGVDQAKIP